MKFELNSERLCSKLLYIIWPTILCLDALKLAVKIAREIAIELKKQKPIMQN